MPKDIKKPRVAIVGLTCCEGCEFAILDLGQRFLDLTEYIDLVEFRMIKEDPPKTGPYDICFIEGSAVTKKNLATLKELRRVSKMLIVLGNCAHTGGVHRMKNWVGRIRAIGQVYEQAKGIDNPPILPIADIVKVDFTIPTCPINGEEFLRIIKQILGGKKPEIPQNPVCHECQINGYECLLQKCEICCGPITLGGCEAVCLKVGQPCWGCRGLLEEPDVDKFVKNSLLPCHPITKISRILEVFGIRDDWAEQATKEWKTAQTPKDLVVIKKKRK
jgi:coenzyme F420-reducing hydrogenase gamma subunit